jgi:hypothetical protein
MRAGAAECLPRDEHALGTTELWHFQQLELLEGDEFLRFHGVVGSAIATDAGLSTATAGGSRWRHCTWFSVRFPMPVSNGWFSALRDWVSV